jgi:hypothetical protein
VLTLREHGPLVPADALERPAATLGDFLGRRSGPDLSLDLAWAQVSCHLDLELTEMGPVATHGGS